MKPQKIFLQKVSSYEEKEIFAGIQSLLETGAPKGLYGQKVLVKPNWVTFRQASLSCTHPLVAKAVCQWLLEQGAEVKVGDSPAFGTVAQIAKATGTKEALQGLPVKIVKFTPGPKVKLPCGVEVRLAEEALSADLIFNLPRFKAHDQLLLTLAVKNLFGCVVGLQKPWLHARLGDLNDLFPEMILTIARRLPVRFNLLDAVVAMEGKGPIGGRPKSLGYLLGAEDPVALDTAVYQALGLSPEKVPLWRTAQRLSEPYANPSAITLPEELDLRSFMLPAKLKPITFHPLRLLKGFIKRLWLSLRG